MAKLIRIGVYHYKCEKCGMEYSDLQMPFAIRYEPDGDIYCSWCARE